MIENPEYRARLRRKLEQWPDCKGSPLTINDGLELLVMVEHQEKTIREWRKRFKNRGCKNKSLKAKNSRLEKEANWLAEFADGGECPPDIERDVSGGANLCCDNNCKDCWREAARKAVEKKNGQD